ncbi:Bax inhibitor-1 family protein [Peredibacter sp. HCB2-198]|uniref:Bax inhibitor-1/YccA family protein n=1 Tax=Peredibacter sp. HCB2-198 TaxID=3383025 RepID=UPI0038B5B525
MEPTFSRDVYSSPTRQLAVSQYMSKVYLWMTMGILLTGFVAYGVSTSEEILSMILTNKILFWGLIIAEFALVIFLSAGINKMNSLTATAMFLLYAAINGATLSIFSLVYTSESIQSAFFTTTVAFAGLSAFGFVTKRDLGPVGSFCTMGLFGLVGFGLLSIFFPSLMGTTASKIYGLVGIIVFAGLTAYDTQAIKNMAPSARDSEQFQKGAVLGALKLYLDFINLFLFILRMSGDRRR